MMWSLYFMDDDFKILVVSQPKAGTYLCGNILEELGFQHSYIHISEGKYEKYDPNNMVANRKNPGKFTHKSNVVKAIELIKPGWFGMTHVQRNQNIDKAVKDYKIIFLERDFASAKESWGRFVKQSNRPANNPKMNKKYFERLQSWKKLPNCYTLTFDQMISSDPTPISMLQKWLWGECRYNSRQVMANAKSKDSLTKSKIR